MYIEELKNYTYQEAAELLGGISPTTVHRMVKDQQIKHKRVGQTRKPDGTLSRGRPRIPGWALIEYNLSGAEAATFAVRSSTQWQHSTREQNRNTGGAVSKTQTVSSIDEALKSLRLKRSKKKHS